MPKYAVRLAGRAGPQARPFARHKQSSGLFVSGLSPEGIAPACAAVSHMRANLLADIAMIERVLQNPIDNALRQEPVVSSPRGGSSLRASQSRRRRASASRHGQSRKT